MVSVHTWLVLQNYSCTPLATAVTRMADIDRQSQICTLPTRTEHKLCSYHIVTVPVFLSGGNAVLGATGGDGNGNKAIDGEACQNCNKAAKSLHGTLYTYPICTVMLEIT